MQSFLEETLQNIKKNHPNLDDLVLILPSKRAGGFLKNYLLQTRGVYRRAFWLKNNPFSRTSF
jgi:hypothetical protein